MKIETLDDWNLVLAGCGCCPMPECPVPLVVCEAAEVKLCSFRIFDDAPKLHPVTEENLILYGRIFYTRQEASEGRYRQSYQGEGSGTYRYVPAALGAAELCKGDVLHSWVDDRRVYWDDDQTAVLSSEQNTESASGPVVGGVVAGENALVSKEWDSLGNLTSDVTEVSAISVGFRWLPAPLTGGAWEWGAGPVLVYDTEFGGDADGGSAVLSFLDVYDAGGAAAAMAVAEDLDWQAGDVCAARMVLALAEDGVRLLAASGRRVRRKFRVPVTHAGSWFKVSWDYVFFPAGYDEDDPEGPAPEVVSLNHSDEWEGPGEGGQEDGSWDFSGGWHDVPMPPRAGEVRMVNIRYECYRSTRFGTRPQVMGEAVELPEEEEG
jgi:hypothetical protein